MLSVKDMMAAGFDYSNCKYINETDYATLVANGCRPFINDVLVAKDGSYLKTAFVQTKDIEQAILSSIAILTPNIEIINPFYLACFFKAPHTKAVVEKHYLTGTAIKRVILKGFKQIQIPVPALPEQERIVAELDLLAGIIDKQKAQLKELDTLAQSIFYDMFGDPIINDKQWDVSTINDTCTITCGQDYKNVIDSNGEYPIYGTGGIMGRAKQYRCPKNSVIIGRKGNINNPILVLEDFWNVDTAFGVTPNDTILSPFYFFFFCKHYDFTKHDVSVTIPSLRRTDVLKISFPVPPVSLQKSFAQKIQSIESQKETINRSIAETQKLFDYTMDKYFGNMNM